MRKLFPFRKAPIIETTTILQSFTSGCKNIDSLNSSSVINVSVFDTESNAKMLTDLPYFGLAMIGFFLAIKFESCSMYN